MSTQNGGNPFVQWMNTLSSAPNQAVKQWEGWFTEQMDRLVRSESFLERAGKAMTGSFQFKAQLDRLMEQNLRAMRVPTVGDVSAVFGRIDEIERRIDALDETLDGIARAQTLILSRLEALEAPAPAAEAKPAAKKAPAKRRAKAAPKKSTPAKEAQS